MESLLTWLRALRSSPRTSPVSPPHEQMTILGRYRVESVLGHGGTASVVSATDLILDRKIAIKIWNPLPLSDSPKHNRYIGYFLEEAKLLASIDHNNICRIYDFGIYEDLHPWLVMELLEGKTLREAGVTWRQDGRPHDIMRSLRIALEVADALAHLQNMGLTQLDVKPDNVMVLKDGRTKLVDLASATITKAGDRNNFPVVKFGTPGYIAPEILNRHLYSWNQLQLDDNKFSRSDVFSFGIMLLELFCLENPLLRRSQLRPVYRSLGVKKSDYLKDEDAMLSMALSFGISFTESDVDSVVATDQYCERLATIDFKAILDNTMPAIPQSLRDLVLEMVRIKPGDRPRDVSLVLGRLKEIEAYLLASEKIFISHSSKDKQRFVEGFAVALRARGVTVWYDSWDLRVGEPFWDRIAAAIQDAKFVIIILSKHSITSKAVSEELRYAQLENIGRVKILPLVIDRIPTQEIPIQIRSRHFLYFPLPRYVQAFEQAVDRLITDIKGLQQRPNG